MELVRRIFKRRPKSIAQVQARELEAPELVLTEGKPLVEAAHDYVRNHEALTPLLNELHAVSGRDIALRWFEDLQIKEPGVYESPYELFRSTVSLIQLGGEASLKPWLLTAQSLGQGPNILFVLIEGTNPLLPMALICCKLTSTDFLARYLHGSIRKAFGL